MSLFCPSCEGPLDPGAATCPACSTPAAGAWFSEGVAVSRRQQVAVPLRCCCCLRPSMWIRRHSVPVGGGSMIVPMPWCWRCSARRFVYFVIEWVAMGVIGYGLLLAAAAAGMDKGWVVISGMGLFSVALILYISEVLPTLIPFSSPRGHVRACLAFDAQSGRLTFRNRAFARIWRRANGYDE